MATATSDLAKKLRTIAWERSLTTAPVAADYQALEDANRAAGERAGLSAIFILPSLLNHSCCANVAYRTIGPFLFMKVAAHRIRRCPPAPPSFSRNYLSSFFLLTP